MNKNTIEGKLLFAQNAITNALGYEEIKNLLANFGYTEERLQEGQQLYERASELQAKQQEEYGEQFAATDALNAAKATANREYMNHVKIARIAFRDDRGAAESLQLTGDRRQSLSGWLKQARVFYANGLGNSEVLTALGRYGITTEKLTAAQGQVAGVEQALNNQLKEKGEAQVATQQRDEAFDALQEWMGDFIAIARIALESQPQYLEVLGVVQPG